jgi:hypothetical protein
VEHLRRLVHARYANAADELIGLYKRNHSGGTDLQLDVYAQPRPWESAV